MSSEFNDLLYSTQSISDYQHCNLEFNKDGSITWEIVHSSKQFRCPVCGSKETTVYRDGFRDVKGLAMGESSVTLRV